MKKVKQPDANYNFQFTPLAKEIFNIHQKATATNATLKSLTKRRAEALKANKNIIAAIEQGIITEQTKARLVELENQISQLDFEIAQEQQRNYTNVTIEDIEQFLKSKIFTNTNDLQVRKLIINTFIREIIYYNDKIIITYNFTDDNEPVNPTDKHRKEVKKQSETAVFSSFYVSPIFSSSHQKTAQIKSVPFFGEKRLARFPTLFGGSREEANARRFCYALTLFLPTTLCAAGAEHTSSPIKSVPFFGGRRLARFPTFAAKYRARNSVSRPVTK